MAEFFDHINEKVAGFIEEQPMFFTATACSTGRINLSPKGLDCFRILGPNECGYMDLSGSGNETAAHVKNDGRVTFMFNSFSRTALIVRLYGKGKVLRPHNTDFCVYADKFPNTHGMRQLIIMDVESVQTSCGYAVPEMELKAERQTYSKFVAKRTEEEMEDVRQARNITSIDGFDTGLND